MSYRLRNDEVQHELLVHGLATEGDVCELRKRLQQALANKTPINNDAVGKLDVSSELEIIEEKYYDLQELADAFDAGTINNEYLRIEARIQHLVGRLQLIDGIKGDDQTLIERVTNLTTKVKSVIEILESKLSRTPDVHKTEAPSFTLNAPENKLTLQVPSPAEPVIAKAVDSKRDSEGKNKLKCTTSTTDCHRRSVPVYKWNIKFDVSQNVSMGSFLERIEELRFARGVSEKELLKSAVDLFTGSALIWHRSNRHRIKSWEQLKGELKAVYQNPDYDHLLLKEILNRTQGEHENIDLYLAAMDGLYSRLTEKIPEEKQLAQILKNLSLSTTNFYLSWGYIAHRFSLFNQIDV